MFTLTEISVAPTGFVAIYNDTNGGHYAHIIMAYGIVRNLSTKDAENLSVPLGPYDFSFDTSHEWFTREEVVENLPAYVVLDPDLYRQVATHAHAIKEHWVTVRHSGVNWTVAR
jgi:hypothetical protein